jgi:hypothetical protein
MLGRKFILNNKIQGAPKLSDFKLVEETLPELKDGGIVYLYCSIQLQINILTSSLSASMFLPNLTHML